jgi:hypothetical protein
MMRFACPRRVASGSSCFFFDLVLDSPLAVWNNANSHQNGTGQDSTPKSLLLTAAACLEQRSKET